MPFDYNINHYKLDDLKTLFNVKENENVTPEELDMRIANIKYSAQLSNTDKSDLISMENFLLIAKEKYLQLVQYYKIEYDNIHGQQEIHKSKFIDSTFLDKNEHAIIDKTKDTKIPTQVKLYNINTSDRDKVSWPYSSNFEINLPEYIKDVTVMGLYDYNFYFSRPNFTNFYQNTKLTLELTEPIHVSYMDMDVSPPSMISASIDLSGEKLIIELKDGFYSDYSLCKTIEDLANQAVKKILANQGILGVEYDDFKYYLDAISLKLTLYNLNTPFKLYFNKPETYEYNNWQIRDIYNLNTAWGLGYFLGFNKEIYSSSVTTISDVTGAVNVNAIVAPNVFDSALDNMLYLEIDGYNHAFQSSSKTGKVNSYFARIPIMSGYSNDSGGLENRLVSSERIQKIKLKLRFHNGILFDTFGQDYDITINFRCKK